MTTLVTAQVNSLTKRIHAEFKDKDLTTSDIVAITLESMQVLRGVKGLTGPQKKEVVLRVLRTELEKIDGNPDLLKFVNDSLPSIIDTFVYIAKRGIKFTENCNCFCFKK